jgi:hypothetical protein
MLRGFASLERTRTVVWTLLKFVNGVLFGLHLLCGLFLRDFLDCFRLGCYRFLMRSCYDA